MDKLLIDAHSLQSTLPDYLIFDVRHDLNDPAAGHHAYQQGHIPGAIFLDHERDLAAPQTGTNGRHPLPTLSHFAALMRLHGLAPTRHVLVYDEGGCAFAAHLWWMLRWLGHTQIQVLDGGWAAWLQAGGAVAHQAQTSRVTEAQALEHAGWDGQAAMPCVDAQAVLDNLERQTFVVLDARAPARFRGEVEPMDPVAGHIPGARNRPASDNMTPQGRFKPAAQLRAEFQALLGNRTPAQVVHQCGSGITACQNLFAMEWAGLHGSVLYPGSWSEWCSDPARPIATGEN